MTVSTFRELTTEERRIIDRLLERGFPGRAEIRQQLDQAQVRVIDADGSLELKISNDVTAGVVRRVPVEAQYNDVDGVPVHILLHVVRGKAAELGIFKSDGSDMRRRPASADLHVEYPTD